MAFHIISIGISSYKCGSNLQYAADDAELVMDSFSHSLDQAISYKKILTNGEASLTDIRAMMDSAGKLARKEDTLIFFFSGHGTYDDSSTFLAPYDIIPANPNVSGLSSNELRDWIEGSKYGTKIILLDCCYSGGVNAKSLSKPAEKDIHNIKAINDMTFLSKGNLIFTACRSNEEAYELPSIKHGVFTYCLINELANKRNRDSIAASDILNPVQKAMHKVLSSEGRTAQQTPTTSLYQEGTIEIPALKKWQKRSPEFISTPRIQDNVASIATPELYISEKNIKRQVKDALALVNSASIDRAARLSYQSHLSKIVDNIRMEYQEQPKDIYDRDRLEELIADTEAGCVQLIILAVVTVLVSDKSIFRLMNRQITPILSWKNGKSGTNVAVEIPDVIVLLLEYAISICSIYAMDFNCLGELLNSVVRPSQLHPLSKLADYEDIHYADSLGGNARNVLEHVIKFFDQQKWLHELLGISKEDMRSLVLQSNLCLCVAKTNSSGAIYAAYNNYDIGKVIPLVDEIHYNKRMRELMLPIFSKKLEEQHVATAFADSVEQMNNLGGDRWWGHRLLRREDFVEPPTLTILR